MKFSLLVHYPIDVECNEYLIPTQVATVSHEGPDLQKFYYNSVMEECSETEKFSFYYHALRAIITRQEA